MQNVVSAIIMEMKLPLATANGESRKQMLKLLKLLIRSYFRGKAHFKQEHQIRSECWRIDGGCINHMIYDETLFKDLHPVAKARIGDGRYILAKGKGIVTITTSSRTKTIF